MQVAADYIVEHLRGPMTTELQTNVLYYSRSCAATFQTSG